MQDDGIDLKSKSIFIDLPMPGNEFKSIDCETSKLKPLGEEREIVVRSPSKRAHPLSGRVAVDGVGQGEERRTGPTA
jgi:hypothetical protein